MSGMPRLWLVWQLWQWERQRQLVWLLQRLLPEEMPKSLQLKRLALVLGWFQYLLQKQWQEQALALPQWDLHQRRCLQQLIQLRMGWSL